MIYISHYYKNDDFLQYLKLDRTMNDGKLIDPIYILGYELNKNYSTKDEFLDLIIEFNSYQENRKEKSIKNNNYSNNDIDKDIKYNKISVLTQQTLQSLEDYTIYLNLILHDEKDNKQMTALTKYVYNFEEDSLKCYGYNLLDISEEAFKIPSNIFCIAKYLSIKIYEYYKKNENIIDFYMTV